MLPKRWWLSLAAASAALALYAMLVEPLWLQVRRSRIHVRGLPASLERLRIALLTDLHAGGGTPHALIRRAVRLTMRERPHLIALTGDFAVDHAPDFSRVLEALDGLHAPLGVYAVPGNHDYMVGIERWHRQIAAHPVIVDLTNRAVLCELAGARICVAGVDDYYMGTPRVVLPPPDRRDLTILLAHTPDQAERCRRSYDAVDLILSGHTHGGQVRFPVIGAALSSVAHPELYEEGLRRRPWTQVYTSRGVGTAYLPLRLMTRPEVAILELTGAPRGPRPRHRSAGRLHRRPLLAPRARS